jgi:hypothetical protein
MHALQRHPLVLKCSSAASVRSRLSRCSCSVMILTSSTNRRVRGYSFHIRSGSYGPSPESGLPVSCTIISDPTSFGLDCLTIHSIPSPTDNTLITVSILLKCESTSLTRATHRDATMSNSITDNGLWLECRNTVARWNAKLQKKIYEDKQRDKPWSTSLLFCFEPLDTCKLFLP